MIWFGRRKKRLGQEEGKERVVTGVGVLVRGFLLLSVMWFGVPWVVGLWAVDGREYYGGTPIGVRAEVRSIRARVAGQEGRMGAMFPEGRLFAHSFYGFTLVNVAVANPQDAAGREEAVGELRRLIPIVEALGKEEPFHNNATLRPRGGVIAAGHANLLRAGYVMLQRQGAKVDEGDGIVRAFHAGAAEIHAAFMASKTGNLETYPGYIWPVDNLAALESLRLHDVAFGTNYAEACRKWEAWMREHLDKKTGMMVAQIGRKGDVEEGPRGCALSWSLAFLPTVAPELGREQWAKYRSEWGVEVMGAKGFREWAAGEDGRWDADSGPVVGGMGMAASGLGIAAAKANGDAATLTELLRGYELMGLGAWEPPTMRKSHFGGTVLLADELAVWGKTQTGWDKPVTVREKPRGSGKWYVVAAVATGLVGGAMVLLGRSVRRAWVKRQRSGWVALGLAGATVGAWALVPTVPWVGAVVVLGLVEAVERRVVMRRKGKERAVETVGVGSSRLGENGGE